ncbi:MAG: tRNA (guanosine(37)-N1)-methyltransferase TrmD [Defluviitaleaceae bacterium]|nr:tRNA (guanosine(37)-N1)-methyltransferase TrmD [Defluviitaleaceae bacterium]
MTFHVLTLFPEMIGQMVSHSILGRAIASGFICVNTVNIRDFAVNKHGQVDDAPYGGGAGMVMMAQPVYSAWEGVCGGFRAGEKGRGLRSLEGEVGRCEPLPFSSALLPRVSSASNVFNCKEHSSPRTIYLSPQGKPFTQAFARELSEEKEIILLCGHYEGVDERVIEEIVTDEVSIGDYVLTGGEPAALVVMDAVSRLIPGVINKEASHRDESFGEVLSGGLEYPQYTRPPVFRGREVPEVLLSGHHGRIDAWRREQSFKRTRERRPDLL